jgi:hypothetical protein
MNRGKASMATHDLEKRVAELEKTVAELGPQSVWSYTFAFVLEQALIWAVCLGLMLYVFPQLERIFVDFNMSLPRPTVLAFKVVGRVNTYLVILLPALVLLIGCLAALVGVLYAKRWRALSRILRLLNFVLLCLLAGFLFVVVALPLVKLLRGLAGLSPV